MSAFKKNTFLFPLLLLGCFFFIGLHIYSDYGASADEHIQIDGGHIYWRTLMRLLNQKYPEEFDELPELDQFQNRYYGQAAMFPVVIYEAIHNFSQDSSTIIAVRHLWSFLCYFAAAFLFALLIQRFWQDQYLTSAALLLLILQPRLFGDIFYNDRDLMLISWMLIFLFCFDTLIRKKTRIWVLLTGFSMAMAVNTRIFGAVLIIFPAIQFIKGAHKKGMIFMMLSALAFMFVLYPIAWGNPLRILPQAAEHFLKHQRSLDTGCNARLLFMNQKYYEHQLPWYYLPVYTLISTPVTHLIFGSFGFILYLHELLRRRSRPENYLYLCMLLIFISVMAGVFLTHPTFYNGWRHFYFLSLPILFFAVRGFSFLFCSEKKTLFCSGYAAAALFAIVSAVWTMKAHPYQIIYLNPLVREKAAGKFDRDYWLISTPECLTYLNEHSPEGGISVFDVDAFIDYASLGMEKDVRERFIPVQWRSADEPVPYILYNYSNKQGNEAVFPGYSSVYAVERDGMKIAEVFQYDMNFTETDPAEETSPDPRAQIVTFKNTDIKRVELYECTSYDVFPSLQFSFAEDNDEWIAVPVMSDTPNGFRLEFPVKAEKMRIELPGENEDWRCGKIILRNE